jgi:hypothetical protein
MKKFFFLCCAVAGLQTAQAQIKLGFHAGANTSFTDADGVAEIKAKTKFTFGTVVQLAVSDLIAFSPEVNFVQKGLDYKSFVDIAGQVQAQLQNFSQNINYLEIPININFGFKLGSGKLNVSTGPAFALALSGVREQNNASGALMGTKTLDFGAANGSIRQMDWSANIGVNYTMSNGLYIKGNYTHGISNLENGTNSGYFNRNVTLGMGYFFTLSK